jgi:DNA-binding NtrC family response regulator
VQSATLSGATLLVVDDEATVRRSLRRVLGLERVAVLEAADGEEAIRVIERDEAGVVDAVLVDLILPVVTGPELITVLRECRPDLPVVAMTGHLDQLPGFPPVPLLLKPFAEEHLVDTLGPLLLRSHLLRQRAVEAQADAADATARAVHLCATGKELRTALRQLRQRLKRAGG